jgi:hypothetical protein
MKHDYEKEKAVLNCKNKIHFIRALRLVSGASLVGAFAIMNRMGEEILKCEQIDRGEQR